MYTVHEKNMGNSSSSQSVVSSSGSTFSRLSTFRKSQSRYRPQASAVNVVVYFLETGQQETLILSPGELPSMNDVLVENRSRRVYRTGSFFSKTASESGEWVFEDGILRLRWLKLGRVVEFTQVVPSNEIEWKSDTFPCELEIIGLEDMAKYLPVWIIPLNPEVARKIFARNQMDRELLLRKDEGTARGDIASQFRECALCFFKLHLYPVGVMRYQSKRSCGHYLHAICANSYKSRKEANNQHVACPICLKRFTEVKTLPDLIQDPRLWFQLCDTDLTGSLDKNEVMEGLVAVLPVERERLEKAINEYWPIWDTSGDGYIGFQEFIDPKSGLKAFLLINYNIFKLETKKVSSAVTTTGERVGTASSLPSSDGHEMELDKVPPLDARPREWFDYWDQNKNGTLERIELSRALIKTFCVTAWGDPVVRRAQDMSLLALNLWDALGYKPREKISFQEFMKPFGLADQVIHNQIHGSYFGEDELQ